MSGAWQSLRGALRSRTVWVNVALSVVGGIAVLEPQLVALFGARVAAGIVVGAAVANLVLRAVTTKPLRER